MGLSVRIPQASETTFDNATNGFASTNVQSAIEEVSASSSAHYSYNLITTAVTIPTNQQMVVYQQIEIDVDGDLSVDGELILIH